MTQPNATVTAGKVVFDNRAPLALIAGPCQLESRQHAFDMAGSLKELCGRYRWKMGKVLCKPMDGLIDYHKSR